MQSPLSNGDARVHRLLEQAGAATESFDITPLAGGGNNRAYLVRAREQQFFLKHYYRSPVDTRDRFAAETAFLRFAQRSNLEQTPRLLATDAAGGLALMEFIEGKRMAPGQVGHAQVEAAVRFFVALNDPEKRPQATELPPASEACFTLAEHFALVDARIARLEGIPDAWSPSAEAREFAAKRIAPYWHALRDRLAAGQPARLAPDERVISPSDFGFHNALEQADGRLRFVDFEYAGWDDPAKTIADFFLQPAVPVPRRFFAEVSATIAGAIGQATTLPARARRLYPMFAVKWCCILLNEFVPRDAARRQYAGTEPARPDRLAGQLARAKELLRELESGELP